MDSGRYPATVFPGWLRALVTFVVPIAVATTVPVQALRGELPPWQIALALGASVGAFVSRAWSGAPGSNAIAGPRRSRAI